MWDRTTPGSRKASGEGDAIDLIARLGTPALFPVEIEGWMAGISIEALAVRRGGGRGGVSSSLIASWHGPWHGAK